MVGGIDRSMLAAAIERAVYQARFFSMPWIA